MLRSRMEQAKSIVPRLFRQHQRPFDELDAINAYWSETVGPMLAERARPIRVDPPTLMVEVIDPPWIEQLRPMQRQILALLREQLPGSAIERIEFQIPAAENEGAVRLEP